MTQYKLSVVIIEYNEKKNISDCIFSIMQEIFQSYEVLKSYEIILVDDNSSDSTVK